jgi:hypothetical protein
MKNTSTPRQEILTVPRLIDWRCTSAIALCGFLGLTVARAATVDVAGVKVSDSADVAGSTLALNGAGVRYKGPFKVYVTALYLNKKVTTPESALAATGSKRIALTLLREVDSSELGRLFMRSIEDNTPKTDMVKVMTALPRMGDIFSEAKKVSPGDAIVMDWVPNVGTVISIRGKVMGQPFKDPEFFNALMGIWLGKNPSDWMLKEALLGSKR